MIMSDQILVVIPAFNEEKRICHVVNGAKVFLPVLVVDDGSSDGTAVTAEGADAQVIRQIPNQGKGEALRTGFSYALEGNYRAVITIDADGQHDPVEIPKFLHSYEESAANLIIGRRDFSQMPPIRRMANSLGQWSFSWALGQHIPDNQSGYRLIDRKMMAAMLSSQEGGFEFEVDMIVTCIIQDMKLAWVPIQTIYRDETSHISAFHHTVNFARMIRETRRRVNQEAKIP